MDKGTVRIPYGNVDVDLIIIIATWVLEYRESCLNLCLHEEQSMGVKTKGKRKIIVADKTYRWNVILDNDSPCHILNIISEDKSTILSCPLKTETPYIISKGNVFQNHKTNGLWNRYLLPFHIPEIITPKFVSTVILWATQGPKAIETKWNGKDIPV